MGDVAKSIENPVVFSYSDLPGFSVSTVSGHAGNFILGTFVVSQCAAYREESIV